MRPFSFLLLVFYFSACDTVSVKETKMSDFAISDKNYGDPPFVISAPLTTSPNQIFYSSSDEDVVIVEDNVATIVASGSAIITAFQQEGHGHSAASIDATLVVNPVAPILQNFYVLEDFKYNPTGFPPRIFAPTSQSPGKFTYTSSDEAIAVPTYMVCGLSCQVDVLELKKPGVVTITAHQQATHNFTEASVSTTITILE